jgi:alpha-glucosidase (family GH31 glycosyl hydrolase)
MRQRGCVGEADTVAATPTIPASTLALDRGSVRIGVRLDPLTLDVTRGGTAVISGARPWLADGVVRDRFVQITEGVLADEDLGPALRVGDVEVAAELDDGVELRGAASDGRSVRVTLRLPLEDVLVLEVEAEGPPLRVGLDWVGRPGERCTGLGPRHGHTFDQSGRSVRLGADRRYTGEACPGELRTEGGIPQGDYAPVPWVLSSGGWAAWVDTWGEGARFELGPVRSVSARAAAGPLRVWLFLDPTPAARLCHLLRMTGLPALLPEWAYGHWKSRDVHQHADDVFDDLHGYRWHGIPLDAIVIDSPWETQYNTWQFNPRQFPDPAGLIGRLRVKGVRTVVWITPWVNLDSTEAIAAGQVPPDGVSEALHRQPASNYSRAAADGHFIAGPDGEPLVARWWMGTGSPVDFTSPAAEAWWRGLASEVLDLGVEGIKADDGEGFYIPPDARFHDGRSGAEAAWDWSDRYRTSMQRALDEAHPGSGVLFARSGWTGGQRLGVTWGGDQLSDFWSLRALVAATLTAAASGYSNWSHDVGGYLGRRAVERCPRELLLRWAAFGCFSALMQAHGRFEQEAWAYDKRTLHAYRALVVLHERLVPYIRAAAATAARSGLPLIRPLCLVDPADPRGWQIDDAYLFGPSLWVAPVLEEGARSREVPLPRGDWIDLWTGEPVAGGGTVVAEAPLECIPVFVRAGSILPLYPAQHVSHGLGDVPEEERPLDIALWGEPPSGRTGVRLADGTRIRWRHGDGSVSRAREVRFFANSL